jgi:hypothetical protein
MSPMKKSPFRFSSGISESDSGTCEREAFAQTAPSAI